MKDSRRQDGFHKSMGESRKVFSLMLVYAYAATAKPRLPGAIGGCVATLSEAAGAPGQGEGGRVR